MAIKLAINGVGRIGRAVIKLALEDKAFNVTHINDTIDKESLFYLLKYDSTQSGLEDLKIEGEYFSCKNSRFLVTSYKDNREFLPDADILIDATGIYNNRASNEHYINSSVKKVVLTSLPGDDTEVAAYNINEAPLKNSIVSFGSCTTTPLAFILDILRERRIRSANVSSIHSYNADQNLLDSKHERDLRIARSSTSNIIPIGTGAAKNLKRVLKDLDFEVKGIGIRVPTPIVSVLDIVLQFEESITKEEINRLLKERIEDSYKGILATTSEPKVSTDFIGSTYAGVVDLSLTYITGNLAKIVLWHDNEYGYASYLLNFLKKAEKNGAF